MPAGQGNLPMSRLFGQAGGGTSITSQASYVTMPRPGTIIGLSAASFEARTAGSATFEVLKSGAGTGITCALDALTPQFTWSNPTVTTGFNPGDYLNVRITTDAGWLPVSAEVEAVIWVEIEGGTQPPASAAPGGERT